MARWAVQTKGASIRQACADFSVSATCYRYQPKRSSENAVIADWLVRLTHNQRNWGFGLCFLHLRNVEDARRAMLASFGGGEDGDEDEADLSEPEPLEVVLYAMP